MYWSYILAVIGVTGIFFVGRKTIWGWHILLLNETLWITYAVITKQYGFIFSALAYGIVYVKSYMLWRKEEKANKVRNRIKDKVFNKGKYPEEYGMLTEL